MQYEAGGEILTVASPHLRSLDLRELEGAEGLEGGGGLGKGVVVGSLRQAGGGG